MRTRANDRGKVKTLRRKRRKVKSKTHDKTEHPERQSQVSLHVYIKYKVVLRTGNHHRRKSHTPHRQSFTVKVSSFRFGKTGTRKTKKAKTSKFLVQEKGKSFEDERKSRHVELHKHK